MRPVYGVPRTPLATGRASRITAVPASAPSTPYDTVISADTPYAHWKLGTDLVDRIAARNLTASLNVTQGVTSLVTNNDSSLAASFAGTGYAQRPTATDFVGSSGFSVEAWVRTTAAATEQTFVAKSTNAVGTVDDSWLWGVTLRSGGAIEFWVQSGSQFTYQTAAFAGPWATSTTYHVVGTFDPAVGSRVYVNAVAGATQPGAFSMLALTADTNAPVVIGAENSVPEKPFTGSVDEVAYYTTALSLARVQAHYAAGGPRIAAGGTAAAGGGTASLAVTLTAATGLATAGGGATTLADTWTAAAGTAAAGGGTVSLAATFTAATGTATAGGGTATATGGSGANLTAATGTATAAGSTTTLTVTYVAATGAATAGGGTVSLARTITAAAGTATAAGTNTTLTFTFLGAAGTATASGGTVTLTRTSTAATGTASASGGTVTLTVVLTAATGTATAGGGTATASGGGGVNVSAAGGTATASGSTTTLTFTLTAATGTAAAAGGTVTATIVKILPVTSGTATAGGGTLTLAFAYIATVGTAIAGGGNASSFTGTIPSTHPALGGSYDTGSTGGLFTAVARGGTVTVHTRGGVVTLRPRGGTLRTTKRGGTFDSAPTGGVVL